MAVIFDIQKCSFVDGDGIRTAVFFKGCNLNCKWCHNPEGIDKAPRLLVYKDRCVGCKRCVSVCKDQYSCTLCGKCADVCEGRAREICGREYTAEELLSVILSDREYYDASSGGVTFSGGECMLQPDFLCEMLKMCKEHGISTAVDTAGNVPFSYFERVIPYTDTFLYDVKCVSEDLHREGTGVSNRLILDNLKRLSDLGCDITVRIPVIGGFNDTDEEFFKIREALAPLNIRRTELLPYHRMGEHKAEAAGIPFIPFGTPDRERICRLKEIIEK